MNSKYLKTTPLSTWVTILVLVVTLVTASSVMAYRLTTVENQVQCQQIQINTFQDELAGIRTDIEVIKTTLISIKDELVYQRERMK